MLLNRCQGNLENYCPQSFASKGLILSVRAELRLLVLAVLAFSMTDFLSSHELSKIIKGTDTFDRRICLVIKIFLPSR